VRRRAAFDYTTVGHVTVDVLADGSRRPGGSAFYSALQAARLGQRTLILTQGSPEVERLLAPYRGEIELELLPAPETTTLATATALATSAHGVQRAQRVLAWAGPIAEVTVDTAILHLAPVARETPRAWRGRAVFVGITPQGLARDWEARDGAMLSTRPDAEAIGDRCDALVVSEHERASCAGLISVAIEKGTVVAVTAGARPTAILMPDGREVQVAVPPVQDPREDLGAGDVFAAAFFVALAEGQPPTKAAAFANAAAAMRVSDLGTEAIGDRPAVQARLHDSTSAPD
jgi:sugar/nucleoside kinase (ribokinase family)